MWVEKPLKDLNTNMFFHFILSFNYLKSDCYLFMCCMKLSNTISSISSVMAEQCNQKCKSHQQPLSLHTGSSGNAGL